MTKSKTDLAWAAGFIDGEGSLLIQRWVPYFAPHRTRWAIRITVVQKDPLPLLKLQEMFGGSSVRKTNGRPISRWELVGRQALNAIEEMLPYFIAKKAQALLLLEFGTLIIPRGNLRGLRGLTEENKQNREKLYNNLLNIRRIDHYV